MRSKKSSLPEQVSLPWHPPGLVAGVDEAGRGPLVGPVVAAAVILDDLRPIAGLADSKKLTEARREKLFDFFDACLGNAAAQGFGADLVVKLFTPRGREFLGVGQARNRMQVVQNHRRCHHGPGQGTTAGLVHASHQAGRMPGQAGLLRLRERGFSGSHRQPVGECCAADSRAAP